MAGLSWAEWCLIAGLLVYLLSLVPRYRARQQLSDSERLDLRMEFPSLDYRVWDLIAFLVVCSLRAGLADQGPHWLSLIGILTLLFLTLEFYRQRAMLGRLRRRCFPDGFLKYKTMATSLGYGGLLMIFVGMFF